MSSETEHERIEAEIDRKDLSNDPFAAVVRATRMPMIITDPHQADNPIVFCNSAFCKLTGYSRNEIIGHNCRFLQGADTDQATIQEIRKAIASREPIEIQLLNYKKNGETFWNRLLVSPVFDEEQRLSYFFASQLDLTPEKMAEQSLRQLNEALEERVVQSGHERSKVEEQLRQSQKMEAVGQLTGGLAHDFNNLLMGIMGNLELLQMRIARGQLGNLDRFINAAQGDGRRAASLTHRLLAFARRQTLDPKATDVNRLIRGLEEMLHLTVGATTDIEIVGADSLWTTCIDAGQLENAILNLCLNGRDASPEGGKITIETANIWIGEPDEHERDLPPGQYISICVTDKGTGMSSETIRHAFEPFYTTKPIGEGTGLGLSMIYGFAKQSGGGAQIYSEVGEGTTVCIYLPRHHGEADAADGFETVALRESTDAQTVLVVEDQATVRHLICEVLDDLGYTVIGVADGAAGIEVLQSGTQIELLITDMGLPSGMNGRQVADAARALRPSLRILFITGFTEHAAGGHAHLAPGMELLTKPFTLKALSTKVADMLGRATPAGG